MMEILVFALTIVALNVLLRPLLTRMSAPAWAIKLKTRSRPRVILAVWGGVVLLLGLLWLIGETRGLLNGVMLLLWIGVPLAALRLTAYLFRS